MSTFLHSWRENPMEFPLWERTPKTSGLSADDELLGGKWLLASVNFGGLPFCRQSHKMLDVRVMPVANAYCKPERDGKEGRWAEPSRFRPRFHGQVPRNQIKDQRKMISLERSTKAHLVLCYKFKQTHPPTWYSLPVTFPTLGISHLSFLSR